jgi:tetratricopeptide (TPR) repeat protein
MRSVLAAFLLLGFVQESPLERARAKFEEARAAEKSGGDFETPATAALAAFDEAVKADGASVDARAGRGEARAAVASWRFPRGDFSKRADLEAAIADFDEAIKLDPARAASYAGRGFARCKLSVARMFARGQIDELFKSGFEDFSRAIELGPTNPAFFVLRGDAQHEKAIYYRYRADAHKPPAEAALADYRQAIKLDASLASALEARIAASVKLSESPVAVDDTGPPLIWSKTWELARREARIRKVPIFFYVSGGAG